MILSSLNTGVAGAEYGAGLTRTSDSVPRFDIDACDLAKVDISMSNPNYTSNMRPMDGCEAAAAIGYYLSEVAAIYPITPSTPMAQYADKWMSDGRLNMFGQQTTVKEMQSEAGAAGALHGVMAAGALATTFTASQGLLLMMPNIYKLAGEQLPAVLHIAARSIAGQALSIFGDQSDVMALRSSGACQLCSSTVQEVNDLALVAHLSALKGSLPFLHFFDGFRTSHELTKIDVTRHEDIDRLVDFAAIQRFRDRALNPDHPVMRGTSEGPDVYFQIQEACQPVYDAMPEIVLEMMEKVAKITGRHYKLFDYFGADDATEVVIVMGSGATAAREVCELRNARGAKCGVVSVHLYRPFSAKHLLAAIPQTVTKISVLDRVKDCGAQGEPLYVDICAAFQEANRPCFIIGGRYGLSSKDFSPAMAMAVFDNLVAENPKTHFTVGIEDDVSKSSLIVGAALDTVPKGTLQCMFWGLGSDGTVGANHMAIKIIAGLPDIYTQGYFAYDALKAGGYTISQLRFGKEPQSSSYGISHADYISIHQPKYVTRFEMLEYANKGAKLVINCKAKTVAELEEFLPGKMKKQIFERELQLYVIDASSVAMACGMDGRLINVTMQTVFFNLVMSEAIPFDTVAVPQLKAANQQSYGRKGQLIVDRNNAAVDKAVGALIKIDVPAEWANAVVVPLAQTTGPAAGMAKREGFIDDVFDPQTRMEGDKLPVSAFPPAGQLPMGTTQYMKRGTAINVPEWNADRCIQCNQCAFYCPHAVIRPFVLTEEEAASAPEGMDTVKLKGEKFLKEHKFRIQVSTLDCTGCGICSLQCPQQPVIDKETKKVLKPGALTMKPIDSQIEKKEPANWEYVRDLPNKSDVIRKNTVKGSAFQLPLMEFSGACAGCGETPYVRLVTQLFGDRMVIANATGCSSIWGGSYPYNPYTKNPKGHGPAWANSLFEDGAEYGYGMLQAYTARRAQLVALCEAALADASVDAVIKKAISDWLANRDDPDKSRPLGQVLTDLLAKKVEGEFASVLDSTLKRIYFMKDMFTKQSLWIFGGDGFAYDIGFGGLDHVVASNEDVNILILDTEVYSNTGGQRSKSTMMGAVHKFAAGGKDTMKKDLGMMMTTYPNVYVAAVAMGSNPSQCVKAMIEAENHKGPSIVIALSPCIEWGIRGGLTFAEKAEKMAVDCGYWLLYRYNPDNEAKGKNPMTLDTKKPKPKDQPIKFLELQTRFKSLMEAKPEVAQKYNEELRKWLILRFMKYERMAKNWAPFVIEDAPAPVAPVTKKAKVEAPKAAVVQKAVEPISDVPSGKQEVTILFGTEGGHAEDAAGRLADEAKEKGYKVTGPLEADEYFEAADFKTKLLEVKQLVVVSSTTGDGDIPECAEKFHQWLVDNAGKKVIAGIKFAVFGLGNHTYPHFCYGGKRFYEALEKAGGSPIYPVGLGDAEDPDDWVTKFVPWKAGLWEPLEKAWKGASAVKVSRNKTQPIVVLFGSESGTAEGVADEIVRDFESRKLKMSVPIPGDDCDVEALPNAGGLVVACSTGHGGSLPTNIQSFVSALEKKSGRFLHGLPVAIFGLGSSSYPGFCAAAIKLGEVVKAAGGTLVVEVGKGDSNEGYEVAMEPWIKKAAAALE